MVGACRQTEALDGAIKQVVLGLAECAIALGFAVAEPGVRFARARQLTLPRSGDPGADNGRGLAAAARTQFRVIDPRNFELQINAIEQRPGDSRSIAIHLIGRTAAAPVGIAGVPARARVHRGNQLKAGRKVGLARRSRNRDVTGLDRFSQHFEDAPVVLGKLIQKQDAVMGKRHFAGPWH